jgi:hypothetical protein
MANEVLEIRLPEELVRRLRRRAGDEVSAFIQCLVEEALQAEEAKPEKPNPVVLDVEGDGALTGETADWDSTAEADKRALFQDLRAISMQSAARLQLQELGSDADLHDENGLPA